MKVSQSLVKIKSVEPKLKVKTVKTTYNQRLEIVSDLDALKNYVAQQNYIFIYLVGYLMDQFILLESLFNEIIPTKK